MAHLKHTENGTEVEVDDATAQRMVGDGWKAVGDADDKPQRRRSPARKAADD